VLIQLLVSSHRGAGARLGHTKALHTITDPRRP